MAVLTAAYAVVALACFVALRSFALALHEMATTGGGIGAVAEGMGEAARWPFYAAIVAALATVIALAMSRSSEASADAAPSRTLWPVALSLGGAIAAVLLFRSAVAYALLMITPGTQALRPGLGIAEAITNRFVLVFIAIAICIAIAVLQFVRALRMPRPALRFTAAAVIVSLCVSGSLIVYLRSYSQRALQVATAGGVENLPDLPPHFDRQPRR